MNMKKRPRIRDLLRAAGVILFYIAVPIWAFMVAVIVNSFVVWAALIVYVYVLYFLCGRFEHV